MWDNDLAKTIATAADSQVIPSATAWLNTSANGTGLSEHGMKTERGYSHNMWSEYSGLPAKSCLAPAPPNLQTFATPMFLTACNQIRISIFGTDMRCCTGVAGHLFAVGSCLLLQSQASILKAPLRRSLGQLHPAAQGPGSVWLLMRACRGKAEGTTSTACTLLATFNGKTSLARTKTATESSRSSPAPRPQD